MKNFGKLALLGAALAVSATSAFATPVTFSSTGEFISDSSNVITFGSGANTTTVTFTGILSTTLNAPTNTSFGLISYTYTGTGASGSAAIDINLVQTAPVGATGDFVGTLAGTLFVNTQTDGLLSFSVLSQVLGTGSNAVTYTLQQPAGGYLIVPPGQFPGVTSIQGTITPAPEPNSLMLLGTGLLGAAGMLFRRRLTA